MNEGNEMIVCVKCNTKYRKANEVTIGLGDDYVQPATLYTCCDCGHVIVVTSNFPEFKPENSDQLFLVVKE